MANYRTRSVGHARIAFMGIVCISGLRVQTIRHVRFVGIRSIIVEVVVIRRKKGLVGWLVRRNDGVFGLWIADTDGNALMNWEKHMKILVYLAPHF
jgi:hypothetical protein